MSGRRIAFLFPGQGSQSPGMGRELHDAFPEAREVFTAADEVLGESVSALCFEGEEASLLLTENTQPAILTVSCAAERVLRARGVQPAAVAGHSLGEYSALVSAGTLRFADALRVVRLRGRFMQDAVGVGVGAMAAILGLEPGAVQELCREAARGEIVVPANYNSPEQTVVAGAADAVRRAVALAEARGARRAILLPVSAPFHSPLMEPARQRLEPELRELEFRDPAVAVISNVDADRVSSGKEAREALIRQVTAPVRWTDSMARLAADGVNVMVEVGPGRVLSGLMRRIDRRVEMFQVEDVESLERTVASLGGMR